MTAENSRFITKLIEQCRAKPGRVCFPEGGDARILAATGRILELNAASEVHVFGDRSAALSVAKEHKIDLEKHHNIVWHRSDAPLTRAGELLNGGQVDAVVAGAVATTAQVIRAAISTVGLAAGGRTVSGAFVMNREATSVAQTSYTYVYADAGVVIDPTVEQLSDIAASTVQTWNHLFKDRGPPVVAFLSFSTRGSAKHPASEKMQRALGLFRKRCPEVEGDGEMQFDAAFATDVGQRKCPGSTVPGRANCFIFPNLDAGNIAYKITQRLAGFEAYGPILQGAAKPFSDLSRGASAHDVLASALINLLRAGSS